MVIATAKMPRKIILDTIRDRRDRALPRGVLGLLIALDMKPNA